MSVVSHRHYRIDLLSLRLQLKRTKRNGEKKCKGVNQRLESVQKRAGMEKKIWINRIEIRLSRLPRVDTEAGVDGMRAGEDRNRHRG